MSTQTQSLFSLVNYGVKGSGLVAKKNIDAGTLLISEPPILRVALMDGDLSPAVGTDLSRQFSVMNKDKRRVVIRLANNYEEEDEVLGIYKTNAMIISPSQSALFPWVCRANHSCVPNCNYIFNHQLEEQQMYASRLIRKGEELTVSYLPDNLIGGVQQRRSYLQKTHNFTCMCDYCNREVVALKQDEYFREIAVRRIGKMLKKM